MMNSTQPTYHSADYRTYPAEWLRHNSRVELLMQVCESLEEGRWEPFTSIKGARVDGDLVPVRDALRF